MTLALTQVESGYAGSKVIHGLNLTCNDGAITAVIGPNGAGKTTLLKTILRLIALMSGKIAFNGEDVSSMSASEIIRRGMAYVPQDANVFPQMTVREDLMMGGYVMRDKKEVMRRIDSVVEVFPVLKERLNQRSGFLSGGERRMLAIARALVSNPKLLLLDEPSIGLDVGRIEILFGKLSQLNNNGLSVLITEQNVKKALEIADYAYVLNGGLIGYEGVPEDLRKISAEKLLFGKAV